VQQLSVSEHAAAESRGALAAREAEMQSIRQQSLVKDENVPSEQSARFAALGTQISQLQAALALRDEELERVRLRSNEGKSLLQLESEIRFAEQSNLRLQQKNEESLELLSTQSSQISMLQSRLKAAEDKQLLISIRSPEFLALSKEKDALSAKVSSLSNELLKLKEQYLQAISKEHMFSMGQVAILEQKLHQSKMNAQQPRVVEGDASKESKGIKQMRDAQLEQQEARIQDLKTALIESSAAHGKLASTNTILARKLKETQSAFKNLVVYCHDLEAAGVVESTVLENEALKLKVTECRTFSVNF
jgi:hypothetical protein